MIDILYHGIIGNYNFQMLIVCVGRLLGFIDDIPMLMLLVEDKVGVDNYVLLWVGVLFSQRWESL